MVRDGIYYALGMLAVAAVLWWLAPNALVILPLLLAIFFLWFFRDPERTIPAETGLVVSPADGKVTDVSAIQLDGKSFTRISIFLSVFDVHVNRSPITGVIKSAVYQRGKFLNAMDKISADANEQNVVTVEGDGGVIVVFKQIAGLLARRIVFNHKPGDMLVRGQRVGLIKFGSRTDVILPQPSDVKVQVGDRVKGGSSVLARGLVSQNATLEPVRERTGAIQ